MVRQLRRRSSLAGTLKGLPSARVEQDGAPQIDVNANRLARAASVMRYKLGHRRLPRQAEGRVAARAGRLNKFDCRLDPGIAVGGRARGRAPDMFRSKSKDDFDAIAHVSSAAAGQREARSRIAKLNEGRARRPLDSSADEVHPRRTQKSSNE